MVLYIPVIQIHCWMIHQQTKMNYIRLSVILSKLITSRKWILLLKYETDSNIKLITLYRHSCQTKCSKDWRHLVRAYKRAIPTLAIIQGVAAIGRMMIKGINALVNAKRASLFNNAIKLINENVQITHDRLIILENRTAMMAKAIIPVLKDFKQQINNTLYVFE